MRSMIKSAPADGKHQMTLNNRQLRHLRGLCHALNPVVIVGDKGLNENVMAEIEQALDHHELIKVRLRTERGQRREWADQIATHCAAEQVHAIGQVVCYYRRNPKRARVELPR